MPPLVLAVANQKGGVGKTTTVINVGAHLAELGRRVLIIDCDPQANATSGLGIARRDIPASTYDVIVLGRPIAEARMQHLDPRPGAGPVRHRAGRRRDRAGGRRPP